jgi:polyhydroxyalkanoate synthase
VSADLFGLQQLAAASLWGSAVMQTPFFALQKQGLALLEFQHAVQQEALNRYKLFLEGYIRYKQIQDQPKRLQAPVVKQLGHATLRDYGALYGASSNAKPVLVIPSLINRSYIFDLSPGFSFLEHMVKNNLHPFLVDWGQVTEEKEQHSFENLLHSILFPFSDSIKKLTSRPKISLMGYCMGGLFGLAAAQDRSRFDRLALLATPWDFHAGNNSTQRDTLLEMVKQELDLRNYLSTFCLQMIFHFIDPTAAIRKFSKFAEMPAETPDYYRFLALEQWVNDSVPLSRHWAEEIFGKWYKENSFAVSRKMMGKPLNQSIPTLKVMGEQDRIVPFACAQALNDVLPQSESLNVPLGHVGLLVSQRAKDLVWQHLMDWLKY